MFFSNIFGWFLKQIDQNIQSWLICRLRAPAADGDANAFGSLIILKTIIWKRRSV